MSGILTVCDANICRSVAAELLLGEGIAVASLGRIDVSSAGVNALSGHSPCGLVVDLHQTAAWRLQAQACGSRQLESEMVGRADLILAATVESRSAVVSLMPSARRRTFTLREALWLADGYRPGHGMTGDGLVRDFVAHLDRSRGLRPLAEPKRRPWRRRPGHPFDIADGHLQGNRAHTATLHQVQSTVSELIGHLSPAPQWNPMSTEDVELQ